MDYFLIGLVCGGAFVVLVEFGLSTYSRKAAPKKQYPPLQVGGLYALKDNKKGPFLLAADGRPAIRVIDAKDGYVKFAYLGDLWSPNAMEESTFHHCYRSV